MDSLSDIIRGRRKLEEQSYFSDTGYPMIRSLDDNNKYGGKIPLFVDTVPRGDGNADNNRKISDIRFNKCPPIVETGNVTHAFPLLPSDYPIAEPKASVLRTETKADSVITPDDYQVFGATPEEWMFFLKPPSFPLRYANAPYWKELRLVIHAQLARRNGDDPSTISRWPDLWSDFDLEDIAKAVNAEYPASLQQQLIIQVFSQGGLEMDRNITQFRSVVDFVGTQVRIAALNTWSFEAVAPVTFMLKWTVGMPRPEEMAWLIATGQYGVNDGVPPDIIDSLASMNLTNATSFTAYEYVPSLNLRYG
jgi:hypothetical protein